MDKKFVMTSDNETYKKLKELGLVFIGKEGNKYRFLNSSSNFSEVINQEKLSYTDILTI